MRFELRLALRYIFSKKSFNFITVISIISFIGITIGVSAIIIVSSIFNGFRNFTEQQLVGFDPHIRISVNNVNNSDLISFKKKLKTNTEIKNIAFIKESRVIGSCRGKIFVFNLIEINSQEFFEFYQLYRYLVAGNNLLAKINEFPSIIIGAGISDKLNILPGDTLSINTTKDIESSIKYFSIAQSYKFIVTGIFQTNVKDFDFSIAFTNINNLFTASNKKTNTYLDLKINNIDNIDKIAQHIKYFLPNRSQLFTWKDLHKDLYKIMNFERILSMTILSLIIMIAIFNVLSSLTMTVIEKKTDIGILTSIGATNKQIQNIFLLQGILIGLIATFTGVILGLLFCYGQINFQWFKMNSNNFLITAIPIKVQLSDIVLASIISLTLTLIASIYPSKKAVKSISIDNIREE